MKPPASTGNSSAFRWTICGLVFAATTINYMDRQVLGILAPALEKSLGWSEIEYGNIVTAFQAAYALGLVGFGRLVDRIGTRHGYAVSVFAWRVGALQDAGERFQQGDIAGARKHMATCHPEKVIEMYARISSEGGITRGEQGLVVSLNTRWLSHFARLRQAPGIEAVRVRFTRTSHDPLAQQRGMFTFHFGQDHELWDCRGEEETGASITSMTPPADILCGAVLEPSFIR